MCRSLLRLHKNFNDSAVICIALPSLASSNMDRTTSHPSVFSKTGPGEAGFSPRAAEMPGQPRFDAVSFRQTAGLVRPGEEPPQSTLAGPPPPSTAHSAPRDSGRGLLYLASWATLGLISATYMAVSTWPRTSNLETALAPVTESLERLATDIADLKRTTASLDARERATAERTKVTETRLDQFAQVAANMPQNASASPQGQRPTNRAVLAETVATTQATTPPPALGVTRITGIEIVQPSTTPTRQQAQAQAPASVPAAKPPIAKPVAQNSAPSPIQTGSIPPLPPARPAGLLVASGPSLDSIRLSWNVLSQTHSSVLGSLEPRIVPSSDGSAFQLIAGPFASDAEAAKACTALKARGVGCKSSDYTGAPL